MTFPMIADPAAHVAPQDRKGVEYYTAGGFLKKIGRHPDVGKVGIGEGLDIRHAVPVSPVDLCPQRG